MHIPLVERISAMRKRQTQAPLPLQSVIAPQLLSIPEVARILNVGRTKVYGLIKTDGLPVVRLGSATRVSVTSLQRWLEQREQYQKPMTNADIGMFRRQAV